MCLAGRCQNCRTSIPPPLHNIPIPPSSPPPPLIPPCPQPTKTSPFRPPQTNAPGGAAANTSQPWWIPSPSQNDVPVRLPCGNSAVRNPWPRSGRGFRKGKNRNRNIHHRRPKQIFCHFGSVSVWGAWGLSDGIGGEVVRGGVKGKVEAGSTNWEGERNRSKSRRGDPRWKTQRSLIFFPLTRASRHRTRPFSSHHRISSS